MSDQPKSNAWPPPPDSASIHELVATADIEGFIADGAPADEYDTEAELLFAAIQHFATSDLTGSRLAPIIEDIWRRNFSLDDAAITNRNAEIEALAALIARFFGPEAQPQVRSR